MGVWIAGYVVFFFKQKTAYEMHRSLLGSEMCIRGGRIISSTYKPFEVFGVSAAFYLILIYGVISFVDWLYNRYTRYLSH